MKAQEKAASTYLACISFGEGGKKKKAERKMKKRRGGFDQISQDNNLACGRLMERESLLVRKQVNDDPDFSDSL